MAKTKKLKPESKKTLVDLPNNEYKSRTDLEKAVEYIGEQMLEKDRLVNEAESKIAAIRSELEEVLYPVQSKIEHVTSGVAFFVKKNREELFPDPNLKTCKMISGSIQFRKIPASVKTKGTAKFFEKILAANGLLQRFNDWAVKLSNVFIRVRIELNKEAILAEPLRAKQKLGVEINEEKERLYIKPSRLEDEISADADIEAA
ncbi:host-nuclease inhibitor Gam family protein [Leptospira interrogans]|uniref:Gam-like protein n=1 Tax=Leptospira interrogans serovar Lora str. TE 1992 TaxID=1193028 RepID=M3DSU6_LEPIR|nr:host-nuclease inhibitor Gam family protein [Leptospira interrogans]EMF44248.1 Gam-like protein [Leptospira interrogans serovar Lora str. TE 1992]AKH77076.1 nuclease inhibitor [Leptospira interrogans serovar Bratislava]EJP04948.1 Gam-like protein [Leptospira interrogans serovar Bulgarica str. Mallika]EMN10588.1 Gam-like protein [Leptospira interrogans serovar Muenchen str. Brem 129]KLO75830.1 Gam-like protein [Leptospira interrogans serovar Muenchen]